MTIAWLGSHTFQSSDLEPEFRWEAILVDVIHCIVAIPPSNHEHRVVANDCCVAESVQRLRPRSLHLLPLIFLLFKSASPQIVVASSAIISGKNVHRAIVEDNCMVSSRIWWFTLSLEAGPSFSIQVEIEEIVEVVATLPLVASEEVKAVHESDASSTRPLLWLVSDRLDLRPSVLPNAVSVQVI